MSERIASTVEEQQPIPYQQSASSERKGGSRLLATVRKYAARLAMIGALLPGATTTAVAAAENPAYAASKPSCYGDYCTGQYANKTGCDKDAKTISTGILSKNGGSVGISVGPVQAGTGSDSGEIGVVHLRWSEECGAAWTRVKTHRPSDITYIGIEKDDGYRLQRSVNGAAPGIPAANMLTPMVYGRGDSQFRGYVFEQPLHDITPNNLGTYWTHPAYPA